MWQADTQLPCLSLVLAPSIYLAVYGYLKARKAVFFGCELQSIKYCSVRGSDLCPLISSQVLFRVGSGAFTDSFDCILCLFLYHYNENCCSTVTPSKSCMILAYSESNSKTVSPEHSVIPAKKQRNKEMESTEIPM